MRRSLEDLLLEEGLLDEPSLRQARRQARRAGVSLARALVEERLLTDEALAEMLVRRLHLPRVDLEHEPVDDDAIREVPYDLASARRLLPLTVERAPTRRVIRVAMADPLDLDAVDEIELSTGCDLMPLVARVSELEDAVHRHYRGVITKMIPRRPPFGAGAETGTPAARAEPTTQPHHSVTDEADAGVKLQALIELLVDRGLIDRGAFEEIVRRLHKERSGG
ncbi:MAG TPA: hypothetical protein VII38_19705 [Polyangia bacterium]|jgi:hypothetical protein